jgi:hypothetical protein
VDGHTTCFGLYGHLQVCKIFSFFILEGICFAAFVACYIMPFLICVCSSHCLRVGARMCGFLNCLACAPHLHFGHGFLVGPLGCVLTFV